VANLPHVAAVAHAADIATQDLVLLLEVLGALAQPAVLDLQRTVSAIATLPRFPLPI